MHQRAEITSFGARAVQGSAVVTSRDAFDDSVVMRVDDKKYDFYVNDSNDYPVGSSQTVFVDPLGKRRPYGIEDADPAGWSDLSGPIGAAIYLALLIGVVPSNRRRRIERHAADGPTWIPAMVGHHPTGEGFEIFAAADTEGREPLVYLPTIELLLPRPEDRGTWVSRSREGVHLLWSALLNRWPDDLLEDSDEEDDDDEEFPPDDWDTQGVNPAMVAGLHGFGSLVLIRCEEGISLAGVRPARDRWTLVLVGTRALGTRALGTLVPRRFRTLGDPDGRLGTTAENVAGSWDQLVRRTAVVGPWVLPLVGLAAMWAWFVGEPLLTEDFFANFVVIWFAIGVAFTAASWWIRGRPPVRPSRYGVRLTSLLGDALVPAASIRDTIRGEETIEIVLADGESITVFAADDQPADRRRQVLDTAATIIEQSFAAAHSVPPPPWPLKFLPSRATALVAVTFAATLLPGLIRF